MNEKMMISEVGENCSIRKDKYGNPRYAGSDPNNYVCFGTQNVVCDDDHLYRIIGIIDGKVKLIKNSFYSESMAWDVSDNNNWDTSTLKLELNGANFYKNTNYVDETSKGYIENRTWYTGGINTNRTLADFEDAEINLSSTGYVGLMSITDFGYASNNTGCERTTNLTTSNNACMNNNCLFNGSTHQWTITPTRGLTDYVWDVRMVGYVFYNNASRIRGIRPALFLTSNIKIKSGKGTSTNLYRLTK